MGEEETLYKMLENLRDQTSDWGKIKKIYFDVAGKKNCSNSSITACFDNFFQAAISGKSQRYCKS